VTAVIQCLIPVEAMVSFMIQNEFDGKVCLLMKEVFKSNFRKRIKVLDKLQRKIDLSQLKDVFSQSLPLAEFVEPSQFYQEFMTRLFKELLPVP
jgi:hypothetical protein